MCKDFVNNNIEYLGVVDSMCKDFVNNNIGYLGVWTPCVRNVMSF